MHLEFLSFTRIVFSQFFLFHLSCVVSRPWKVSSRGGTELSFFVDLINFLSGIN